MKYWGCPNDEKVCGKQETVIIVNGEVITIASVSNENDNNNKTEIKDELSESVKP